MMVVVSRWCEARAGTAGEPHRGRGWLLWSYAGVSHFVTIPPADEGVQLSHPEQEQPEAMSDGTRPTAEETPAAATPSTPPSKAGQELLARGDRSAGTSRASRSWRVKLALALLLAAGAVGYGITANSLLFPEPPVMRGVLTKEEIRRLVGKDDAVILDVGANDGADTRELLAQFPRGRVYAFEPDPRAIRRFRSSTNDPRAVLFEVAIGHYDGTIEFHMSDADLNAKWAEVMPEGWDQSGSIHKPKEVTKVYPWVKFERTIEVPLMRLDTWAQENSIGQIDFMWVDIQGAEKDLIRGAPETMRKTRFFYTEYSDEELYEGGVASLQDIADLLPDFELVYRYPTNALFRNKRLD